MEVWLPSCPLTLGSRDRIARRSWVVRLGDSPALCSTERSCLNKVDFKEDAQHQLQAYRLATPQTPQQDDHELKTYLGHIVSEDEHEDTVLSGIKMGICSPILIQQHGSQ